MKSATKSEAKALATKARKRRWWAKNKDRMNNVVRTQPLIRYNALKARAKREGRKFSMSFETYLDKLKKGCYYCKSDLMKERGGNVDRTNNDNPNYTSRGLVGCCSDCNKIKSDRLSKDEMRVAMKAVIKFRKEK